MRKLLPFLTLAASVLQTVVFAQGDDARHSRFNYPQERITVPSWRFAHGPHVRAAFREVVADTREAVVAIKVDGTTVALGGIVGSDGWILTKASTLGEMVTCEMFDGREMPAELVETDREYDLALLKVPVTNLPELKISDSTTPIVGSWLATVGLDSYPVAVGIVSVEPREIPHRAGVLGVKLDVDRSTAKIVQVLPGSAAAKAGLLVNDVILQIENEETPTREALIRGIQEYSPGDSVKLLIQREGQEIELRAVLMGRFPGFRPSRMEFQNRLGGDLSERRFGFASAFQHDTIIEPNEVGGPVVNLNGEVVGFNIARAGRTETYAIAASTLVKTVENLMKGATQVRLESHEPVAVP